MSWDGPTLLDSFERDGEWWLPGDSAPEKVSGRASFDPTGGVHLKTLRPFPEEDRREAGRGFHPPLILGLWDDMTPVTLYRAARVGVVRPPGSNFGSEFYARYAVHGHHFHDEKDVTFLSLQAGFTDLEAWASHHPFADAIPLPESHSTGYVEMRPAEAEVGSLRAKLTVRSDLKSWALVPMRTLRWEHRVVLEVEPGEYRPLQWYRAVLSGLQEFLTLVVGRPVYPNAVEAQARRGSSARADVFFDGGARQPGDDSSSTARLSRDSDVLLPLPQIRGDLPRALDNWFAKRELLAPVYDLFFGVLFGPPVGPEYQFLSLAQALETYHRRTRPGSRYLEEAEYGRRYEEMVGTLPDDLPGPLKNKLKDMLKYGNEWSLRKRLKDIFDGLPGGVVEGGGNFVEAVVDTRNYLTHYTEELKGRALRGTALSEAVDEMRRLVAFLLFRELGLDEEKVVAALDRVPRHEYFSLED